MQFSLHTPVIRLRYAFYFLGGLGIGIFTGCVGIFPPRLLVFPLFGVEEGLLGNGFFSEITDIFEFYISMDKSFFMKQRHSGKNRRDNFFMKSLKTDFFSLECSLFTIRNDIYITRNFNDIIIVKKVYLDNAIICNWHKMCFFNCFMTVMMFHSISIKLPLFSTKTMMLSVHSIVNTNFSNTSISLKRKLHRETADLFSYVF